MVTDNRGLTWLCLLLLLGTVAQPASGSVPELTENQSADLQSTQPTTVYTVSVERHGANETTFRIRASFRGLDSSQRYVVAVPAWVRNGTEVRDTVALAQRTTDEGNRFWIARGNATDPSMTVALATNATVDIAGRPRIGVGAFDVVDLYRSDGTKIQNRTVRFRGPAVRVEDLVYFGEANVSRIVVNDRRTPFVIPAGVDVETTPTQVSRTVNRTARFYGFPAPPETLSVWYDPHIPGTEGRIAGSAGYDTINLIPEASNATIRHEYVHIRQRFGATTATTWFVEGGAEYLAALPTLRRNDTGLRDYYESFDVESPNASHRLPEGRSEADVYVTGKKVVAALDLRLRTKTNGTRSVVDVVRYLNRRSTDETTLPELYDAVRAVGGDPLAAWLRDAMETRTLPRTPDESAARAAILRSYPNASFDGDRLSNRYELTHRSDPFARNSDGDGLPDGVELSEGLDPTARDTDGDGAADSADPHPHASTLGDAIRVAGTLLMALSLMSVWLTAGVAAARAVDRFVGIVPDFLASRSLRRLAVLHVAGLLLGVAVWVVGWAL